MTRSRAYLLLAALCAIAIALLFLPSQSAHTAAQEIMERCGEEGDRKECYEREVSSLYPLLAVPEVFEVVRAIRNTDTEYQFCHVLAHKLGERVVAEDPERWLESIALNPPDGMCSNGFIHGVVGGRFKAEVLDDETLATIEADLARACEPRVDWHPSPLDQAICYHGLGHLYDFITDANIPKALSLCERTADPAGNFDFRRMCREGVFMQLFQPLEPDDFLLIEKLPVKLTADTARSYCATFVRDEYEGACLRETWPLFREQIIDGSGVASYCSGHPNAEEETHCYEGIAAIVGRFSLNAPDNASLACTRFPHERQIACFVSVAQAAIEENRDDGVRAVALCRSAPRGTAEACTQELIVRSAFLFGADEPRRQRFCSALETPGREQCLGMNSRQ